ncbi:hypothetical protein Ciccas_001768 [Cichlidogyrus casuarinus]|uniref:Uncharacterized protein n=1 Tax=Cichlidogyrus casuarinus TaxID=1844966 RepID=A0ABD2QJ85_9PLAT
MNRILGKSPGGSNYSPNSALFSTLLMEDTAAVYSEQTLPTAPYPQQWAPPSNPVYWEQSYAYFDATTEANYKNCFIIHENT